MPSSSSTVKSSASLTLKVAGLTEAEAGRLLSRLRYMQSIGLLSKEISVDYRTESSRSSERDLSVQSLPIGLSLRRPVRIQGCD